jgi:hypothetical protein
MPKLLRRYRIRCNLNGKCSLIPSLGMRDSFGGFPNRPRSDSGWQTHEVCHDGCDFCCGTISMIRLCGFWCSNRVIQIRPGVSWRWPKFTKGTRAQTPNGPAASGCRLCATGLSVSTTRVPMVFGTARRRRSQHSQRPSPRRSEGHGRQPHPSRPWRLIDLVRWQEEFRVSISKQTLSRELRNMGFRKLSARPRHHAQDVETAPAIKKTSSRSWQKLPHGRLAANPR